jgi:flagellar brake protein
MLAESLSPTATEYAEKAPTQMSDFERIAEEYERFARQTPSEISIVLRTIAQRRDLLTVASKYGQIVTQLMEVDAREGRIVFDWGGVEEDNRRLLQASQLSFKGSPDGVRVEFTTGAAHEVMYEGRPAFEVAFPEKLYHFQRREFFRVPTPILDAFTASGVFADGTTFRCELQDMSMGGISLRTDSARMGEAGIGTAFTDVSLTLGAAGTYSVDLELVSPRMTTNANGVVRYVIGFRFTRLPGPAESMLQKLITKIEAKRRSMSA